MTNTNNVWVPDRPLAALRAEAQPVLDRIRAIVSPTLHEATARLRSREEFLGIIIGYHLGFNDRAGKPECGDTGGLGGTMCLAALAAEAVRASTREVINCAAAMELAKDLTQLQDDIIDNDPLRRERPSAWSAFGIPATLLSADATRAVAFDLLAEHGTSGVAAMHHLMATLDTCTIGQAKDIGAETRPWRGPGAMTLQDYRDIALHKTSSILACTYSLGAVLAAAPSAVTGDLATAGRHLGMAWQVLDDLLDLWGQPADASGMPSCNDLRQRKKTFPVLSAVNTDHPAAQQLCDLLESGLDTDAELLEATRLIAAAGGRAAAEREVRRNFAAAMTLLRDIPLMESAKQGLVAVSCLIGTRGTNKTLTVSFPAGEDEQMAPQATSSASEVNE